MADEAPTVAEMHGAFPNMRERDFDAQKAHNYLDAILEHAARLEADLHNSRREVEQLRAELKQAQEELKRVADWGDAASDTERGF